MHTCLAKVFQLQIKIQLLFLKYLNMTKYKYRSTVFDRKSACVFELC